MPRSERRRPVLALPAFVPDELVNLIEDVDEHGAELSFAVVLRVSTKPRAVVVSHCGVELAFSDDGRGRFVCGGYVLEKRNRERERASVDRRAAPALVVPITKR